MAKKPTSPTSRPISDLLQMPIRVRPEVRDGLDRFAKSVHTSRDALVRGLLEGFYAAILEMEKAQKSGLFDKFALDMDAAMDAAVRRAVEPPTVKARRAGFTAGVQLRKGKGRV